MKKGVFDIDKFNVIEDDENYYFFRALNNGDYNDITNSITSDENGIKRIRTDRERFEESNEKAKYSSESEISLEEVWDHIKIRYIRETNCISLSANTNVSIDYGQMYNEKYAMIKVPKTGNDKVYNAGQYMIEEINKIVEQEISQLPQDSNILSIIKKIEQESSYKGVKAIIADAYDGIKNIKGKYTGHNNYIKAKETVVARFNKKQYFSEEQQLEYNKLIAKLTVIETSGKLKSILPTKQDNSSLIATVGLAFSSGELIHYKDIQTEDMVQVSKEIMNILSLIQQLKNKGNDNSIKALEKKVIGLINDGYELKIDNGKAILVDKIGNVIKLDIEIDKNQAMNRELSIEDIYTLTKGKISYERAKIAIEFIKKLSKSRIDAINYSNIIMALGEENKEIAQNIKENCFVIDKDIISREDNIGFKIAESVNIGLTREERSFVSNNEQLKLIEAIQSLNIEQLRKIAYRSELGIESTILEDSLEENEEKTENQYFAEAIVDGLDFGKIYKTILDKKRIMTEEERTILVEKIISSDCKRLYNAFKKVGAKPSEISNFIINLLLHEGYKGYSIEELSKLENLDEIISTNVKNNNLRQNIPALKLDETLEIKDDSFEIEGTDIKLRDYQKETLDNIDRIFETKRFAGMVLPTGAGKSFVAMSEIMKFKGKNIVFIAPQNTILHQFEVHVLKNILHKQIITEEELNKLKEKGQPIPANVIQPKNFKKVLEQEIPSLKMFCYEGLAEKSEEWLKTRDADLIIFDELHRTGAKTWEPQIKKLIDLNPKAKILGMTATPVRDVDGKDMAKGLAKMLGDYTEEELINEEYLASNMQLLDAMKENYVVSPNIVTFDYTLKENDEYHEIKRMIEEEKDNEKLKELVKIKNEMDAIIKNSEKEGMSGIVEKNIKKKNGKYIIFLPQNPNSGTMSSEEYMKSEIEKIKEYFKGVNPNIKTSYLLSDRKNGKVENSKALDEFENSDSDDLHLIFAIDMLNEGVHVDGIDGAVMMRPISENSKILYLQQIGRCIFSEDPNNQTKEEDKPIIFDVYNNYLAQNMDREVNKTTPISDLQKLKMIINWIDTHKGYIPDINSENLREAKKAVTLKNIQKKYKKYLSGIDNNNLNKSELHEIEQIVELGESIGLWDIEIPDRIIPPGERDIIRNETFMVTGTQKRFLDLFKKANGLVKGKKTNSTIRLKSILAILDVLSEYGVEINNKTIEYNSTLKDIIDNLSEEIKENIQKEIEDLHYSFGEEYKIGEEYNFAKESFYNGREIFTQYDIKDLRKYGIFEEFVRTKSQTKEKTILKAIDGGNFIIKGLRNYINYNINTGTIYDEEGYNVEGLNEEGFGKNGFYKNDFRRRYDEEGFDFDGLNEHHFGRNGNYYEQNEKGKQIDTGSKLTPNGLDKNGDYWEENEKGKLVNTHSKFGKDGYSLYGMNKFGFFKTDKLWYDVDRTTGKPINRCGKVTDKFGISYNGINEHNFGRNGNYYEQNKEGEWVDTGSKLNPNGLDKNGDYWEENENGELVNTHSKFGKNGYSLYGINKFGFSKIDKLWYNVKKKEGKPMYVEGRDEHPAGFGFPGLNEYNFWKNGNYYEQDKDGHWIDTRSKTNSNGLDINGDYCVENENGELVNTHSKFGKNGYSLYGINKFGFSNKDELWYGVDVSNGKSINKIGKKYDLDNLDINRFDKDGYYYKKQENGTYINTKLKYNEYGFEANKKHIITKNAVDLRKFDINGVCKGNNDSIYDKNGFKQDGTYKETGEKYHNGYNAFGVNENGKMKDGREAKEIAFTKEYINAILSGKRLEVLKKMRM